MTEFRSDCLNVLFSSDDGYAQHLGAAMYSLLEHNSDFNKIQLFIVDNHISVANKARLETIGHQFPNAVIVWVQFDAWEEQLKLDMAWSISVSSYARLFVGSMIPANVEKILYLDCDMIVCRSLKELWNTDLQGCVLGAVQDFVNDRTKASVGVAPHEKYINAGMLLIDLNLWRKANVELESLRFINEHQGNVTHHDQGVLNGVLRGKIHILPLRYNLMTIHYMFNRRKLSKYYLDKAIFYSEAEVEEAKKEPTILHYTPSFTSRPWVRDCCHPLKKLYWQAVEQTPWRGTKYISNNAKWYVRLIDWRYRNLPF